LFNWSYRVHSLEYPEGQTYRHIRTHICTHTTNKSICKKPGAGAFLVNNCISSINKQKSLNLPIFVGMVNGNKLSMESG